MLFFCVNAGINFYIQWVEIDYFGNDNMGWTRNKSYLTVNGISSLTDNGAMRYWLYP